MRSKNTAGLSLAALVLLSTAALAAPPLPSGQAFRVNVSSHGRHFGPKAAVFADGGFVVVWTTGPVAGGRTVLHARFFTAAGSPASGEFRLTEPAAGSQTAEDIAADADGTFLAVWREERAPGGPTDLFARRFRRDGTPAGARIPVSVPAALSRHGAHLAIGPGGRFAVAWNADDETTGPFEDAIARCFRADGRPEGPEFPIWSGEPEEGDSSATLALARGVALQQDGTLEVFLQIQGDYELSNYLQEYLPDGKIDSARLAYPNFTEHYSTAPDTGAALAMAPDGRLIAVLEYNSSQIRGQRLSSSLDLQGSDFPVPGRPLLGYLAEPGVAALSDGGFVTIWVASSAPFFTSGRLLPVFVRVWNADGTPASRDFQFTADSVDGSSAVAASTRGKGPVVVAWAQRRPPGPETDVYARLLTSR